MLLEAEDLTAIAVWLLSPTAAGERHLSLGSWQATMSWVRRVAREYEQLKKKSREILMTPLET